jgi:hypothetical protein
MEKVKMWNFKEDLIVGLIEGIPTVRTKSCWNGGIDSCIEKIIKNVTIYVVTFYNKEVENFDFTKHFIDLGYDYFIEFEEFENTEKLYNYFIYGEEIEEGKK